MQSIKNLDKKQFNYQELFQGVLQNILAIIKSWDLFSEEQVEDANNGLRILIPSISVDYPQLSIITVELAKFLHDPDMPLTVKSQVCETLKQMVKLKAVRRALLQDCKHQDTQAFVHELYLVLNENATTTDSTNMEDV